MVWRKRPVASSSPDPAWHGIGSPTDAPSIPTLTLMDGLRPTAWVPGPYHLDIGERLATTLVVIRFPAEAWNSFLYPLYHLAYSRRMSWWIQPLSPDWTLTHLGRRIEQLQATLRSNMLHGQAGEAQTPAALEDALQLRQRLARQETRMYGVSFAVTLFTEGADSESVKEAMRQQADFLRQTRTLMFAFRNASFDQEAGFWSTAPVGKPPMAIPQELDAESVALMFPFIGGDVLEPGGVIFGTNPRTAAPIIVQWYDLKLYPAGHMVVAAKTRSGKTVAIKYLLIQHLLRENTEALILDPSAPIDYQALSQMLGTYVRLRPGSRQTVNPLEIRYPDFYSTLDPADQALLDRKIEFLVPLIGLIIHPETQGRWDDPYERAYVESICQKLYAQFGITNDPLSLFRPDTVVEHWAEPEYKRMPILSDLQAVFAGEPDALGPRIATILEPWIHGTLAIFNGPTTVDLSQRLVTLNVEAFTSASDELRNVIHYVVGEVLAQRMMVSTRRKLIVLDEAHVLFANKETGRWAARLYRMAAKSNAQVILITQGLRDLIGDPEHGLVVQGAEYAQTCLTNSYLKLLMHQDTETELGLVEREFGLSPDERQWLQRAETGMGLLVTHRYHVPLMVLVPPVVLDALKSDPAALNEPGVDPLQGRRPKAFGTESPEALPAPEPAATDSQAG